MHRQGAILLVGLLLGTFLSPLPAQTPTFTSSGVVHAASYSSGYIVRGSIATIFGTNLASTTASAASLPLPTTLGGTQVLFGSIAAPLFYVSPTQINLQVPFEIPSTTYSANVVVKSGTASSTSVSVYLSTNGPALFTMAQSGGGPGVILHADGGPVNPWSPVKPGEDLVMYGTGFGAVSPAVKSGEAAPGSPVALVSTKPTVTIGGKSATVTFAGLTPGLVGLYQINIHVPEDLTEPTPPVVITQSYTNSPSSVTAGGSYLMSVEPKTIAAGAQDTPLRITGMHIPYGASLNFGGRVLPSTLQNTSPQVLTATIPACAAKITGSIPLYLTAKETGSTSSNNYSISITGTSIKGTAPLISNISIQMPAMSGSSAVYTGSFDFTDADGDIVFNGSTSNSATLEYRNSFCSFKVTGLPLNVPDQTSGRISYRFVTSASKLTIGTPFSTTVTLIDQAGNRSNEYSFSTGMWICP